MRGLQISLTLPWRRSDLRQFSVFIFSGVLLAACQANGAAVETAPPPAALAASEAEDVPVFVTAICGDCHAVKVGQISPNPQSPSFVDIANSPGLTRDTLVTFLSDAHNYPMQMDVDLDDEDIELIADYMLTLQSDDYHRTPS